MHTRAQKQSQFSYSSQPSLILVRTWTLLCKAEQQYLTCTVTAANQIKVC